MGQLCFTTWLLSTSQRCGSIPRLNTRPRKGPGIPPKAILIQQTSFGNSQSSGTYGSFKPLSLPNNPTSWEVLILRCWLPLGIPQSIFVCVNHCAVIFMQQLPTLDFFHPESFARDLNSVLTNHPGRKRGVRVWEEVLHNKNFGESFPWGAIISGSVSQSPSICWVFLPLESAHPMQEGCCGSPACKCDFMPCFLLVLKT